VKNKVKILIWMGLVLSISCFLFYTWGCKSEMDKAKKHYKLGVEYHKQELTDRAIEELKQALEIDPNYEEAHYELGLIYHEQDDYKNAFQELQQAVKLNPEHAEAHYRLGYVYQGLKGYTQALEEFNKVLKIDPNFPRVHTAIGNIYYERGLRAWEKAIRLDWKGYLLPDTLQQISYKNKDELKEAIETYLGITESDTADASTFSKLCQAYYTLALDEYQIAVSVDSFDTVAQLQIGLTFSEKGYPQKAMHQYDVLEKFAPRAADMLLQVIRQKELKEKGGEK
jgi:tetratricopeptide (TPR) repeat protein